MNDWWSMLSALERFYALVAIPSTLLLLIQTILLLFGLGGHGHDDAHLESDTSGFDHGDGFGFESGTDVGTDIGTDFHDFHDFHGIHDIHDIHADVGSAHDHTYDHTHDHMNDPGLRVFTLRGFIAFFSIFGWCGLACLQGDFSIPLSLVLSVSAGSVSMLSIALLLKAALKLQSVGTISLANAIGKSATVYMRVPAQRTERGKVNVIVQESYIEADALTDEPVDLPTGCQVTVVGLVDPHTLLVAAKN